MDSRVHRQNRPLNGQRRWLVLLVAALVALGLASQVRADGEAGLVIQDGDVVTTYCIAFKGDGITGDQLLKAAGQTFDAFGGGSGLAVCSIGARGCDDASSFTSCFCECQGGSCTYWAFFTRSYGKNWLYSALAFNLLKAKDGDVHGWKWGVGGPNNAPAPRDVTFEQICAHSPQGGAPVATTPPTATLRPTLPATTAPVVTTTTTELPSTSTVAASPTTGSAATVAGTISGSETATTPLVTLTGIASQRPPTPPVGADALSEPEDGGGSSLGTIVGFGAVAGALLVAIAGAAIWRSRHA